MLDKKAKQRLINKFKVHDTDTGSPQVQIAILTEEINQLTDHLKMHKHISSSLSKASTPLARVNASIQRAIN
jgi:ribosomal protein S15